MHRESIVLEWRLPMGSSGMAAQWSHARIKGQLKTICEQHSITPPRFYTTDDPYRVRIDVSEQLYTLLCLQWQHDKEWDRWRRVSAYSL